MAKVLRHSANCAEMLGLSGDINNRDVRDLLGDALTHDLRNA